MSDGDCPRGRAVSQVCGGHSKGATVICMLVAASFVAQPAPPPPPVPCGGGDRVDQRGIRVRVLAPGLSLTRILARRSPVSDEGKPTPQKGQWVEQSLDGPIDSKNPILLLIEDGYTAEDNCFYDLMAYAKGSTKPIVERSVYICDGTHVWEFESKRHHRYYEELPDDG